MSENNAPLMLKIDHVTKQYRLGTIGGGTLRAEIQSKMAKLMHKEDPNRKIDQKAYDKNETFLALDDISLEIRKGERVGIIGHNGAGKSTLLKLICRVTAPTKGDIYLNGRITSMLEVGTGFHAELTGRENVYMNGAILGMTKEEIDEQFDDIVEFSEVSQFIDTPVKRYSSGMNIKLGFSIASHLKSEIMIMDEVLAVGDMTFQNKCLARMRQVAEEEGRTILYVSHNMATIRNLCNRVIVLDHGKIVFDGDVEDGIAVYLQVKTNDATYIDYTDYVRENWLLSDRIRIMSAEQYDKSKENFVIDRSSEKLTIKYKVFAKEDIEGVGLLLEILSESGEPVGSFPYVNLDFHKGENDFTLSYDCRMLVVGRYRTNFTFLTLDANGRNILEDCIRGIEFKIIDTVNRKNSVEWNKKAHGNIQLPSPVPVQDY